MFEKIAAVITAAACAGVIVTLVPGFAPEIAARASPPADRSVSTVARIDKPMEVSAPNAADIRKTVEQNIGYGSGMGTSICEQTWPYYGRSCLLDGNRTAGNVRVVRVINMERSALPAHDTGRKSQTRTR
jgi:hypothetical protein